MSKEAIQMISPEMWGPLNQEEKDAEKISRPSLTYFQDAWRRLKQNHVAMVSMVLIILITLSAIVLPLFWPYSYKQQNLDFANMPARIPAYKISDQYAIYVNPQYNVVLLSEKGEILSLLEASHRDLMAKKNVFKFEDNIIEVDYSFYADAVKEYKKLEKKSAKTNSDVVNVQKVAYLKKYFADDAPAEVSMEEAYNILENKLKRVQVSLNGTILDNPEMLRNQTYLLGSDGLGRDLFIRIIYGARISLLVGFFAAFINFVVGVTYGAIAGYKGGRIDNIMMRIVDVIDSVPMTLYVILIMVIVGPGILSIIIALGLTYWVKMARIVRGQVYTLKNQEFVKAAIVTGADTRRIIKKHLIPNMMGPIMVNIAMQIPSAIFNEAFLSFVGLGISAPMASWGTLCNDALPGIYMYPYQMIYPAFAIALTILTFNLFSDGLRDSLDPKQRN
ncbi:MAG: ABC transporter permease [Eubacteriales bacterium]|nr:ABC transporter permease [Eubacteriales bacterium]